MIDGLNDRLKLFLEKQLYTYIKDIGKFNFNGYVKEIEETTFLFLDDQLGEIWINKNDVVTLTYSNRNKEEVEKWISILDSVGNVGKDMI